MEVLVDALESAHDTINWFALGDAFRLTGRIKSEIKAWRESPHDPKLRQALLRLAQDSFEFLLNRGTPDAAYHTDQVYRAIEHLQGERPSEFGTTAIVHGPRN